MDEHKGEEVFGNNYIFLKMGNRKNRSTHEQLPRFVPLAAERQLLFKARCAHRLPSVGTKKRKDHNSV